MTTIRRSMNDGLLGGTPRRIYAKPLGTRTQDTLINSEPASRTPSMGRVYEGSGSYANGDPPVTVDEVWSEFELSQSSLTAAETVELRKRMARFLGVEPGMVTNRIGISASTGDKGAPTLDHIHDANARSLRQMRDDNISRVKEIQKEIDDFWNNGGKPAA